MSLKKILYIIFYPLIDLWNDIKTLVAIFQGKAKLQIKPSELFKDFDQTLKVNYVWFIILIIAFLSGMFLSGKYYQQQCNDFIVDNFAEKIDLYENTTVGFDFENMKIKEDNFKPIIYNNTD